MWLGPSSKSAPSSWRYRGLVGGLEGDGGSKTWKLGSPPGPREEPGEPGRHLPVMSFPLLEVSQPEPEDHRVGH